jgi:hypothetical protein
MHFYIYLYYVTRKQVFHAVAANKCSFFQYILRNYTDVLIVYEGDYVEMASIFWPRTDHMILQNMYSFILAGFQGRDMLGG